MAGPTRWGTLIGAGTLAAAMIAPGATLAADPVTVVFTATGAEQEWVVPDGVTSIDVIAIGAPGGLGYLAYPGGVGARVEGTLAVSSGSTLSIQVGSAGLAGGGTTGGLGGFNGGANGGANGSGGGGGGGASDVRTLSRSVANSLDSRLLTAAGGGGGGGGNLLGGQGGDAGANGGNSVGDGAAQGGQAGSASSGGVGGFPGVGGSGGVGGTLGAGGAGAFGPGETGGGGGGGLYGGGGGGSSTGAGGGGGGGGSSSSGSATNAAITVAQTTTPSISITYTPANGGGNNSGVVDAVITVPSSAACLELSTTSIDFGTAPLGAVNVAATANVQVTNCSGLVGSLFARGSDAAGTGAAWTLDDTSDACDGVPALALDRYHLYVNETALSGENKGLASLDPGAQTSLSHFVDTACPGSTGAGTTMSLQVTYLITE